MVKVAWSPQAKSHLRAIHQYYRTHVSDVVANRIKARIIDSTKQLETFPHSGALEPIAEEWEEEIRYLWVPRHWKVIYAVLDDACVITCIWDTRNNPALLPSQIRQN